ncbi:MAG: transglycosylase domain-containing protein [Flavobacteriales bacterium]|nr:transglycosylase domain-containing protein [Flavobacteriales bacterium]
MPRTIQRVLRRSRWPVLVLSLLWAWAKWGPMDPLFSSPRSTVLEDRNGAFLGATVAADGQWRMPVADSIPARFEQCILEFEDRNFRSHWGIHLPSLVRAVKQNYRAGRAVSGGSTITMQVARMATQHRNRSYMNKLLEVILALRLEVRYSKDEILQLYVANAPFGANVVGLEAAAWRWYGRSPVALSWAENALLAVLPNAPSQLHPGQGRGPLKKKRDRLLTRLLQTQVLDSLEWKLAVEEPLPDAPHPLPRLAPHLLATLQHSGSEGTRITSTLNAAMQQRFSTMMERYAISLQANEVHNAAMLILDVPTGEVLAYVGNLRSQVRNTPVLLISFSPEEAPEVC